MKKSILAIALLLSIPLAASFAFRTVSRSADARQWPAAIPSVPSATPEFGVSLSADRSSFVSSVTPLPQPEAVAAVRAAYLQNGWTEYAFNLSDTLLFAKPGQFAAILVRPSTPQTRITIIQSPKTL